MEKKIQSLIDSYNFSEAKQVILAELDNSPQSFDLLMLAVRVNRLIGDYEASLRYARLLKTYYQNNWEIYKLIAENMLALKQYSEAKRFLEQSIKAFPGSIELCKYLSYVNSFLGIKKSAISDIEETYISLDFVDIIAYSSCVDFFKIIQSRRIKSHCNNQLSDKKYVFVAGLGRSGSTALGFLLNKSHKCAMYMELYSPMMIQGYEPSFFSEEKIQETLKINIQAETNKLIFPKHANAEIVGDKMPYFQFCAEASFDNLGIKNTKCVFVDRNLVDICKSSYKRAKNPDDWTWPLEKGIEHTILMYNATCRQINYIYDNRPDIFENFYFVKYEDIFSSLDEAFKIFKMCEINLEEQELKEVAEFIEHSSQFTDRKSDKQDHTKELINTAIYNLLDINAHNKFKDITGIKRAYAT